MQVRFLPGPQKENGCFLSGHFYFLKPRSRSSIEVPGFTSDAVVRSFESMLLLLSQRSRRFKQTESLFRKLTVICYSLLTGDYAAAFDSENVLILKK
jgi:hypothetical protein